jgi:hypothetical protein
MTQLEIEKIQDNIASFLEPKGWNLIDNWLKHEEGSTYSKLFPSRFSCQENNYAGINILMEEAIYTTPDRMFILVDVKITGKTTFGDWVTISFYSLTPEDVHNNLDRYTSSLISSWEQMNQSPDSHKEI